MILEDKQTCCFVHLVERFIADNNNYLLPVKQYMNTVSNKVLLGYYDDEYIYALEVGQSKTLVAVTSPESAVKSVTWYSSNNKIATVSKNGKVTAVKAGTVTITAKSSNGLKATCKVTVKEKSDTTVTNGAANGNLTYVLNTNTKKFHLSSCSSVKDMKDKNKQEVTCSRDEVIDMGYVPCKRCNP